MPFKSGGLLLSRKFFAFPGISSNTMLSDTAIKQAKPADRVRKMFDGRGTGLHLLVQPSGSKSFALKFVHPETRKEQTLTIGPYPAYSLQEAREQASKARALLAKGHDPRRPAGAASGGSEVFRAPTFDQVGLDWVRVRGARWSETYRHKVVTMLQRYLFAALGSRPVAAVQAGDLLAVLRPIEAAGHTDLAHTLLQHAGGIFRFAVATGRAPIDPAAALRGALMPHRQENLAAVTTPGEFAELLRAMDAFRGEFVTKAALTFTMLTFQRSQSVRYARWDQIDWSARLWRVPAEIMKMKEPHLVPLARQTIDLLRAIQPLTGERDYMFNSLRCPSKPLSENTMLYALYSMGYRDRMTVHGFRTTASTLLNENGHNPDVIEAALAHTRGDIRAIYNRAKYLPERAALYQWWADYCDGLLVPSTIDIDASR